MTTSSAQNTYSITLNDPTVSISTIDLSSITTMATVTGSTYPYLASTGTGASSWSYTNPSSSISNGSGKTLLSIPSGDEKLILEKDATLDVKGTVVINGLDLEERLKTIERVLAIPERDAAMEAKYPSLKKKFDEYINTLEKYRTFERIKGED